MGQVRYGRPIPDYTRSAGDGVRVVLRGGEASLEFAALVYERDRRGVEDEALGLAPIYEAPQGLHGGAEWVSGRAVYAQTGPIRPGEPLTPRATMTIAVGASLALDELIVLNGLFFERRLDSGAAGLLIQKGAPEGRAVLERLHERGLVAAQGKTRARVYTLSAHVYERLHMKAEYVRARGFEPLQFEQMILDYVRAHGSIRRADAVDLCRLTPDQASRLLRKMAAANPEFRMIGERRWSHYVLDE